MASPGKVARLSRDDWLRAALATMFERGVQDVKISRLSTQLGVTSGSFYWHFESRQDLLDSLLEWWEREMTDGAIGAARQFDGSAKDRIFYLMNGVMVDKLARYDLAVWHWAMSDRNVGRVFRRVLKKRFDFAAWMFEEAGFSKDQATVRGRMMVAYMMAESTLVPSSMSESLKSLRVQFEILTTPGVHDA